MYLGRHILRSSLGELLRTHVPSKTIAIVTDRNVSSRYLQPLVKSIAHRGVSLYPVIMPQGERQKTPARVNLLISQFLRDGLTRSSAVIALGGGVVGDVAGFAAAIFRRGIPIVQVPTTLLAQVESAIGGKVGVNHPQGKNVFGAFHQPVFVFSDIEFLKTLPEREMVCGLGEMLKYALLDEKLLLFFEKNLDAIRSRNPTILEESIFRCNTLKAQLVMEDEYDRNTERGRFVLNLGHTIGHVLETCSRYQLHHGEAVLLGLRIEIALALRIGLLDREQYQRINVLLARVPFSPSLAGISIRSLMNAIYGHGHAVRFVLPTRIGNIRSVSDIPPSDVRAILRSSL